MLFPDLLTKVRATGYEIGIELDVYKTKFSWAKTPQSLSEELMHLATVIQDSYGYKIERYIDHVGKNGRKKNTSVIRITNQNCIQNQRIEVKYEVSHNLSGNFGAHHPYHPYHPYLNLCYFDTCCLAPAGRVLWSKVSRCSA